MTKTANKWVLVVALMILSVCVHAQITVNGSIFVSSNGNDVTGDGSFDKPYATLTGARNHIRGLTNNGANPLNYNMTVYVRGGKYIIDSTFELSAIDSGTEKFPIVYRNYNDEKVIFDASYNLDPLQATKIIDPSVKNRIINETARDKIYQIDLNAFGVPANAYNQPFDKYVGPLKDTDETRDTKSVNMSMVDFYDLYIDGEQMNIARYPNKAKGLAGYMMIQRADVVDKGSRVRGQAPGDPGKREWFDAQKNWQEVMALPSIKPFKFKYTAYAGRLDKWQDTSDVWMGGFWHADWAGEFVRIGEIDKTNKIITSSEPAFYGLFWNDAYGARNMYYMNILEELDAPGEFYIDKTSGLLYFYPRNKLNEKTSIQFSGLRDDIIKMTNVSYITLLGFDLTGTRSKLAGKNWDDEVWNKGNGIVMTKSSYITVESCNIYNLGGIGVIVAGGTNQSFINMEVYNTGLGGFDIKVGNRDVKNPLYDGNTLIENCELHNNGSGKNTLSYVPSLMLSGAGVTVRHCKIYDALQMCVMIYGNNMTIEYNEFFDVALEASDQGAIYAGRDATYLGNQIRYNYFHDIYPDSTGPYHVGATFWDDFTSAFKFYGNITKDVGKGSVVRTNGGVNHEYYHNIIIGGPTEFYATVDNVSLNYWRNGVISNSSGTLPWEQEVTAYWRSHINSDIRSARFIEKYGDWLKKALVDQDFSMIQTSQLSHKFAYSRVEKNVVIGPTNNTGIGSWNLTRANIGQVGFTDIANNDFSIKDYSAIRSKIPDFPALVFSQMGRQKRPAVKPVAENVTIADWASIDSRPVPKWFTDAKFGIIIHWGLYSVPAWGPLPSDGASIGDCYSEWYWYRLMDKQNRVHTWFTAFHNKNYGENFKYQDFVKDFKCEMFKPDDWAKLFREAGARYVLLTSKHHDGFALWPSVHAWNWNSVDVGPHRDLAGDLSDAVKKEGLRMGFYYSLYEWFNPLYKTNLEKYVDDHMIPQMKDLVNRYSPEIILADGEWEHPSEKWKSVEFLAWLYNESPVKSTVAVNDRWGRETRGKHGGYYNTEYDMMHSVNMKDQKIAHPWEECRGIGSSFGYNRNENIENYSTSEQLVHLLVEKVAKGGNLLLNVGPTADGRIPVIMQQRLMDMGRWLKTNGEAIYETTSWNVTQQPEINAFFTTKGKDLYVIFTKFPDKLVTIRNVGKKPVSVTLLGSNVPVKQSYGGKNVTITLPNITPANHPGEYAWVFKFSECLP